MASVRIMSNTARIFVDPFQGACIKHFTCSFSVSPVTWCHLGDVSNVIILPLNGSLVQLDTKIPSAIATSIGRPCMDPDTSTIAVVESKEPHFVTLLTISFH